MNYRGYGASGGTPGETALVSDGIEIFDWAARRADLDAARIAIHGRSLGTGVAVQVAAARPARCVILTSPFDSARRRRAARSTGGCRWRCSCAIRFDSVARAPQLRDAGAGR